MVDYIRIITGFLLFLLPAQTATAWGPEGHRIVGDIAQWRLMPEAQRKIEKDFNIKRLADVSDWADEVKDTRHQKKWHFTNIEKMAHGYNRQRDCANGECVTEIIPRYEKILRDTSASVEKRKEALMYLVHFVADAHQPLHLGNEEDKGGNNVSLNFSGRTTNLHALWDSDLIHHYKKASLVKYAHKLNRKIHEQDALRWTQSQVVDWTNESRSLALDFAYSPMLTAEVPMSYVLRSKAIIENQLCRAGVRLAHLLNRSLM